MNGDEDMTPETPPIKPTVKLEHPHANGTQDLTVEAVKAHLKKTRMECQQIPEDEDALPALPPVSLAESGELTPEKVKAAIRAAGAAAERSAQQASEVTKAQPSSGIFKVTGRLKQHKKK